MAFSQRELQCFLAVVDTGSIGRAAIAINLSQPALSRLIQGMEHRLRQPLFERTVLGMSPSPAGEAFVPHARLLLFEMSQAVDALDALRGVRRGVARIGAVAAVVRSILPETIATLLHHSPMLQVSVLEGADDRLVQALENREVDLLIAGDVGEEAEIQSMGECRFDDSYMVFFLRQQSSVGDSRKHYAGRRTVRGMDNAATRRDTTRVVRACFEKRWRAVASRGR